MFSQSLSYDFLACLQVPMIALCWFARELVPLSDFNLNHTVENSHSLLQSNHTYALSNHTSAQEQQHDLSDHIPKLHFMTIPLALPLVISYLLILVYAAHDDTEKVRSIQAGQKAKAGGKKIGATPAGCWWCYWCCCY